MKLLILPLFILIISIQDHYAACTPGFTVPNPACGPNLVLTVTGNTGGTFSVVSGAGGSVVYGGAGTATFNGNSGVTYTVRYLCSSGGPTNYVEQTFLYFASSNTGFSINQTTCTQGAISISGAVGGTFTVTAGVGGSVSYTGGTATTATFTGINGNTYTISYDTPCGTPTSTSFTLGGNAGFTISSGSCSTATSVITGTTGGTFSITAGTGGSINASTGALTGVSGNTYTVQYTVCGISSTQSVTISNTGCWSLNGNASYITVGSEQCIQLTAELNDQTGCAWNGNVMDFNTAFTLSLDYYFGNNMGGADGTTFTFQPNPAACGAAGAQLGAGGIPNSLIIEMDTYDNDGGNAFDLSSDHISVEIDGDLPDDPINFPANQAPYCGPQTALAGGGNIDNGVLHSIDIEWDPVTQQLNIYFDGVLRLNCSGDFVNTVFGGDNTVYWGATAATGGLNNQQYFCPETVIVLPTELLSFETSCEDEEEVIKWSTASEERVDYFVVEYTTDGHVFYPVSTVDAAGNSQEKLDYQVTNTLLPETQKYYRLKSVDTDGKINTTDLIAGKKCKNQDHDFLNHYSFNNETLSIGTTVENLHLSLVTTDGKEIINTVLEDGYSFEISNLHLNQGVYFLNLIDVESGIMQTNKIYHSNN